MSAEVVEFRVRSDDEGARLDRVLATTVDGWTRSGLRRLVDAGHVEIDGTPARKAGQPLSAGSVVRIRFPESAPGRPEPVAVPFDVLYEDDDLAVIDKPAGVVVHPGAGETGATLVSGLLHRGMTLASIGAPDRPGIVHRLDRGTSGALVVAKRDESHRVLAGRFAAREVRKRYAALVWGRPDPPEGELDRAIGRDRRHRTRMAVGVPGARRAITRYTTRETMPGFARLDVDIETGRTHQIRVHMQSLRHPVVGDDRYGGRPWRGVQDPIKRAALRRFDRLWLHAELLAFVHPRSGKKFRIRAPLPDDLEALLDVLREPA